MSQLDSIIAEICDAVDRHRSFLICGHEDLDGDCIGSQLALAHWLTAKGKEVVVVSDGPTFANYSFLPGFERVQREMPADCSVEATFCVDTGAADRVLKGVRMQAPVVNIDHHPSNNGFGDINWVDPKAAAVGEMIFTLIERAGGPMTPEIATCLYLAIETDSGAFRFANTTARTLEIAAALVKAGANPNAIADAYYGKVHPDTFRMAGEVMGKLRFEMNGRLAWGEITREQYDRLGGPERQPEQLAAQIRAIDGVEVSILFHEMNGGIGRASFRSRGRIPVNDIAAELGGGGHVGAAGCRFEGDYATGRDHVLEITRRHLADKGD